jgi:hypothetical protein
MADPSFAHHHNSHPLPLPGATILPAGYQQISGSIRQRRGKVTNGACEKDLYWFQSVAQVHSLSSLLHAASFHLTLAIR